MTFGILYEETFSQSAEVWTKAEERPVAPEYERCHIIGHALWNPGLTKESLLESAEALETDIENKTGYRAFLVDIRIQQYPPGMTDVDFIIDVPTVKTMGKKFGPIAPLVLVAIIAVCAVIFAFIVWLFWTSYLEKVKLYYCDQCTGTPSFEGWLNYVAHLAEKHPTKYQAIQENKSKNWWEEIPSTVKWAIGGGIAIATIFLVSEIVRRSR